MTGERLNHSCFCSSLLRLYRRPADDANHLKDLGGHSYQELTAAEPVTCGTCQQDTRLGDRFHSPTDTTPDVVCTRCTIIY
jgi:hypothetical protein